MMWWRGWRRWSGWKSKLEKTQRKLSPQERSRHQQEMVDFFVWIGRSWRKEKRGLATLLELNPKTWSPLWRSSSQRQLISGQSWSKCGRRVELWRRGWEDNLGTETTPTLR